MEWYINFENGFYLVNEDKRRVITKITPAHAMGYVSVHFKDGLRQQFDLKMFDSEKCPLKGFKGAIKFRTQFVAKWTEMVQDPDFDCASEDTQNGRMEDENTQSKDVDFDNESKEEMEDENNESKGTCIKVHIKNLVPPKEARTLRDLDVAHIKELKESFVKQMKCSTILVGYIDHDVSDIDMSVPGPHLIEVIGGNHTRQALQEIMADDKGIIEHVYIQLYENISNSDALKLAMEHNNLHGYGKATSAEDLLRLFHKTLHKTNESRPQGTQGVKEWHKLLSHILGLDPQKRELHNRYKTLLSLAKSDEEIWDLISKVLDLWGRGDLKNTPKGQIRTCHLTKLTGLSREQTKVALETLIKEKDWAIHLEYCSKCKGQSARKRGSTKEKSKETSVDDELREDDQLLVVKRKLTALEHENRTLKEQILSKDKEYGELRERLEQQSESIREMQAAQAVLEKEKEDLQEHLWHYMLKQPEDSDDQSMNGEAADKDQSSLSRNQDEINPADQTIIWYKEGDKVWAKYKKDYYPAHVTKITETHCTVEFDEDKVKKRTPLSRKDDIRPWTNNL